MTNVSVIIPTWNRAEQLIKAIESALTQTLPVLEVLVCDDGSTDNTLQTIKSIKDKRVKWLPGKHTGLPAVVRNRGIKKSQGNWLAFLDSDDEWYPKKLEKQLTFSKKKNSLAVCCNAYGIYSQGERKKYLDYSKSTITFFDLIKTNYIILSSALVHRSLLSKCFGFPEGDKFRNAPDYAFWLRVSTQTNFAYLDEILVNYLDEPDKSIRRFTKNPHLQKKIILANFLQWGWENKIHFKYMLNTSLSYLKISLDK